MHRGSVRFFARLFAFAGDDAEIIARQTPDETPLPQFDRHIPLHSLPLALGLFEPQHPAHPYLRADPEMRAVWRQRIGPAPVFRVGLAWAGNRGRRHLHRRSIPCEKLLPLFRVPGVTFHSLQTNAPDSDHARLAGAGLTDLTSHITDFADTAALISELDLVISVDTSVAHLAGALGKPVWTLLPFVPDWRWGIEREDTPWYPTMRLFRQPAMGDWDSVIQRVAGELPKLLFHRSG